MSHLHSIISYNAHKAPPWFNYINATALHLYNISHDRDVIVQYKDLVITNDVERLLRADPNQSSPGISHPEVTPITPGEATGTIKDEEEGEMDREFYAYMERVEDTNRDFDVFLEKVENFRSKRPRPTSTATNMRENLEIALEELEDRDEAAKKIEEELKLFEEMLEKKRIKFDLTTDNFCFLN